MNGVVVVVSGDVVVDKSHPIQHEQFSSNTPPASSQHCSACARYLLQIVRSSLFTTIRQSNVVVVSGDVVVVNGDVVVVSGDVVVVNGDVVVVNGDVVVSGDVVVVNGDVVVVNGDVVVVNGDVVVVDISGEEVVVLSCSKSPLTSKDVVSV